MARMPRNRTEYRARYRGGAPGLDSAPPLVHTVPCMANGGFGRILVAEDEPSIREFMQHFLQSLGYTVDTAANGRELYEWIRASRPGLLNRLIYITGDSLNPNTRAFLAKIGVPFLLKPVMASVLVEEVRRTLKKAAGSAD